MLRPRYLKSHQRLDQKITIQKPGTARDAMNQPIEAWENLFDTRARAYPSPGFERRIGDGKQASIPITFEVRACAATLGILPKYRVIWRGSPYHIVAPVDQPDRGGNVRIITTADK